MSLESKIPNGAIVANSFGKRMVPFYEFLIMKELLSRCKAQLNAIAQLDQIQKQFIGTMVDTEVAVGYFIRKTNASGAAWVAYLAVKMKYGGDLAYFGKLISHLPPSRGLYANTIKQALDCRWSLSLQGIVAYSILREVRPYLHNEKSIIEVDCILRHGPAVKGELPIHTFSAGPVGSGGVCGTGH